VRGYANTFKFSTKNEKVQSIPFWLGL